MNVGVLEARNRLSELIERAERGEEVVITRHGKPTVRLVAAVPIHDVAKARAAMQRIADRRRNRVGPPVTIEEIIAWKNEGRR